MVIVSLDYVSKALFINIGLCGILQIFCLDPLEILSRAALAKVFNVVYFFFYIYKNQWMF